MAPTVADRRAPPSSGPAARPGAFPPQPKAVMEPVVHLTGLGRVDQDGSRAGPAVAQAAEEVGSLQLHRDPLRPLRPGTVDADVADEKVPPLAVGHRPSMPG